MKALCVLQHVEAEYLGLLEDHLEGRNVRFRYARPFTAGGSVPAAAAGFDGLILLGAGPLGVVSGPLLPSLAAELRLARDFLDHGLPVVGFNLGAVLLAVAAGGGAEEAPLRFQVARATRTADAVAGTALPAAFPLALYLRDRPLLPAGTTVMAADESGEPLVFTVRDNAVGFLGHPGMKSGMVEDLVMEFDDTPPDVADELERMRAAQSDIAEALGPIMVALTQMTGWMAADGENGVIPPAAGTGARAT
ncbi:MAG: hypothetical protein BroJett030_00590 [Alphaproteobacteria bacterium]|nr:MAG: hypothetical protein BroJett030_00590 [Alphaproteobacteria bacterium]